MGTVSVGPGLGRVSEYQELVARVCREVEQLTAAGSTVLVVSKGDPAFLKFTDRQGWHFPRAFDGQYAGHHPADSRDAIARLEFLRGLGSRYLVIPATSAWWFDQYPEFIVHLRSCSQPLLEDAALGWIFKFSAREASPARPAVDIEPGLATQQLIGLLEAVLPAAASIAVVIDRQSDFLAISPMPSVLFRHSDDVTSNAEEAIRAITALAESGIQFLVLPASSREWLTEQPELAARISESYALITDQVNVCTIYDLKLGPGERR